MTMTDMTEATRATVHEVTQHVPAAASAGTLSTLLHRSADTYGRAVALRFEERSWSYRQLDAAVTLLADQLHRLGLQRGDRVAAFGANSDLYVVLFLACARGGFIHVPVNFALKGDELTYLLEDSQARVVFVEPELLPLVSEVRAAGAAADLEQVIPLEPAETLTGPDSLPDLLTAVSGILAGEAAEDDVGETAGAPQSSSAPEQPADPEEIVQLLYTSGTTSAPKGAMMSHRALLAEYVSAIIALDLTEDDRPLIAMPLYHSAAMHVFLMPYLSLGATARIIRKPVIDEVLRQIDAERIGSLFLAPTVWVPLANRDDLGPFDLSSLVKAQYGASIMPTPVLDRLRTMFPKLGFYNCFGQSELGPLTCVLRPEDHEARPASCGRPVHHVEVRVVDFDGNPVATGEPGEIQYRSPQVCSGYWRKPEATAEAFAGGWFRSGDQVVRDSRGYIEVVDRIKDVINTGGVLVAPRAVEDCIYEIDGVAEVAVVGLPDDRWIEAITAFVVLKDGVQLTAEEVQAHVKRRLADFKVPKAVEFVAELPRNQSGKLLKRELRREFG